MRTQSIDSENKRSSSLESPEIIPGEKIAETAKFLNQNSLTKITEKSIRKTNFCQQKDKSFCRRMVKPDERENTSNDNKKTDHKNNTENLLSSKQKASNTKKSDKNPLITGNFETRRNILSNFRERKNKINYLIKTENEESSKNSEKRSEQIENTPWFIISDPSAERPYFYNAKKADTFWKLPDEIKKKYKAEILDIYNKLSRNKGKEVVSPENVIKEDESLVEERHPKEANSEANGELPLKKSRQIGSYEWWEIDDPNSKYLYFFNALKSKTYWDVPLEVYRMYQSMELSHKPTLNMPPVLKKAKHVQNNMNIHQNSKNVFSKDFNEYNPSWRKSFRKNKEEIKKFESENLKISRQLENSNWFQIYDAECPTSYFFDNKKKITQWEKPTKEEIKDNPMPREETECRGSNSQGTDSANTDIGIMVKQPSISNRSFKEISKKNSNMLNYKHRKKSNPSMSHIDAMYESSFRKHEVDKSLSSPAYYRELNSAHGPASPRMREIQNHSLGHKLPFSPFQHSILQEAGPGRVSSPNYSKGLMPNTGISLKGLHNMSLHNMQKNIHRGMQIPNHHLPKMPVAGNNANQALMNSIKKIGYGIPPRQFENRRPNHARMHREREWQSSSPFQDDEIRSPIEDSCRPNCPSAQKINTYKTIYQVKDNERRCNRNKLQKVLQEIVVHRNKRSIRGALESDYLPSKEMLIKPIPKNSEQILKNLLDSVEIMDRGHILEALSLSDIRQAIRMKIILSNKTSLRAIFRYFHAKTEQEDWIDKDQEQKKIHPTHESKRKIKNNKINPIPPQDWPYVCFLCGKRFRTESQLNHHSKNSHFQISTAIRCDFCGMRCVSNLLRKFHMENDCPLKNKENFKVKITDIKAPSMSKDETNSLEWDKLKTISQPKSSSDAEEQSKLRKSEALKVLNETKKSLLWEEDDSPVLEENFEIQKRKNLEKDVQSEKVEKNSKEKEIVGKNVDSVE